jgi:DmsE family decaheme c-type cytochrome
MRRLLLPLLIAFAPLVAAGQQPAAATAAAADQPAVSCADCHADQAKAFASNPHAQQVKAKDALPNAVCESCHGSGAAHIEGGGDKAQISVPRGREGADKTCLKCHDKSTDTISRHNGMHANSATVNCMTCHSIHGSDAKSEHLLVKNEVALCSGCHATQVANFRNKPYGHRLGTGTMSCTSCHEPHGRPGRDSIKQTAAGEMACVGCHADKRGLYVYPHGANSVGDCTSCHETHGSSNPMQLKRATVASLCIECHSPVGDVATLASQPPSFHNLSFARYQNCTTCHTAIHGSNRSPQLLK